MEYIEVAVRALVAAVFAVSAASKLRSRDALAQFTATVRVMGMVPEAFASRVAVAVGSGEALIVLLVLWPGTVGAGLVLAGLVVLGLTGAIVAALRRGVQAPCRCFGSRSAAPLSVVDVVRNTVLVVPILVGVLATLGDEPARILALHPGGVAVAVAAGAIGATLIVAFGDLVDLFRTPPVVPRRGD